MSHIRCVVAETRRELDDALRVRFEVFAEERGYLDPTARFVPREADPFDTLGTTIHLVAYLDDVPIATVRLLLPNAEIARRNGFDFGIDLESKFDLAPLAAAGLRPAETTRFCVLARHRGATAVAELHAAAVELSRRLDVTHWIASANTETDSLEDARLIHKVAEHHGFVHEALHVEPRDPVAPLPSPRRPFYDEHTRQRAAASASAADLAFPRTLALYARRMHARFIGLPIYDARFRMCSMPFVAPIDLQRPSARAVNQETQLFTAA